jgi:predicted enzyme related to lactoylglutathione lyase
MGNPFCWMELISHDLDGAVEFYSKIFDWEISDMPGGPMPYKMVTTGKEPGAGMMGTPEPGIHTCWSIYIEVDDLDAKCKEVSDAGGKIWKEPQDVPGMGRFAVACDPQGAFFCLWQSVEK